MTLENSNTTNISKRIKYWEGSKSVAPKVSKFVKDRSSTAGPLSIFFCRFWGFSNMLLYIIIYIYIQLPSRLNCLSVFSKKKASDPSQKWCFQPGSFPAMAKKTEGSSPLRLRWPEKITIFRWTIFSTCRHAEHLWKLTLHLLWEKSLIMFIQFWDTAGAQVSKFRHTFGTRWCPPSLKLVCTP